MRNFMLHEVNHGKTYYGALPTMKKKQKIYITNIKNKIGAVTTDFKNIKKIRL